MALFGIIIMGGIAWILGLGFVASQVEARINEDMGHVAAIAYVFLTGLAFYVFG